MQDTSSKQQRQRYKPNHQHTGLPPHTALSIRGLKKRQKKPLTFPTRTQAQITAYMKPTETTGPTLPAETKGRKNLILKPRKRSPQTQ